MPLKNGRTSASLQTTLVGSVIPAGTIQAFGGGTVPEGWLLCDGSIANRSTYSALFAAVGTAHGSGDGSTTFHLPDLRGRFLRGADNMGTGAASRDPGGRTTSNAGGNADGLGSVQASDNKSHNHIDGFAGVNTLGSFGVSSVGVVGNINTQSGQSVNNHAITSSTGNATEARPQNAASLFIIKV